MSDIVIPEATSEQQSDLQIEAPSCLVQVTDSKIEQSPVIESPTLSKSTFAIPAVSNSIR